MERIALAIWRNRISPLFDVARKVFIVDIEDGLPNGKVEDLFFSTRIAGKVSRLCDLNVTTLICGAISKELLLLLTRHDIQVIGFIAGNKDDVLAAYLKNGLVPLTYCMPGCGGVRIERRRRTGRKCLPTFRSRGEAAKSKGAENGKTESQRSPRH